MHNSILISRPTDRVVQDFYSVPEIYQMSNGTGNTEPKDMSFADKLKSEGFQFIGFFDTNREHVDQPRAVIHYRYLTSFLVEGHINVLPEFHKKGLGKAVLEACIIWFKDQNPTVKFMTHVPSNCSHVLKFMYDNQFKASGCIPKSVFYNNELVDLFTFVRG